DPAECHAWCTRAQNADDDLYRARDGGYLYEADAEQPEVGSDAWRILIARERRIHEPSAIGRRAEEQAAEECEAAREVRPEGVRGQPGEGQVAGAQHIG